MEEAPNCTEMIKTLRRIRMNLRSFDDYMKPEKFHVQSCRYFSGAINLDLKKLRESLRFALYKPLYEFEHKVERWSNPRDKRIEISDDGKSLVFEESSSMLKIIDLSDGTATDLPLVCNGEKFLFDGFLVPRDGGAIVRVAEIFQGGKGPNKYVLDCVGGDNLKLNQFGDEVPRVFAASDYNTEFVGVRSVNEMTSNLWLYGRRDRREFDIPEQLQYAGFDKIKLSREAKYVYVDTLDMKLLIFDFNTHEMIAEPGSKVVDWALLPEDDTFVFITNRNTEFLGRIQIYKMDRGDGDYCRGYECADVQSDEQYLHLAASPDGELLAAITADFKIEIIEHKRYGTPRHMIADLTNLLNQNVANVTSANDVIKIDHFSFGIDGKVIVGLSNGQIIVYGQSARINSVQVSK
ncbi:MAG: hypothetical protein NTW50_05250 [Candidatus Berkelbacteria bacterium]|nr:hypothetical protein [Candidatus Berkelbacteria bacterium]